jgi:hypothetical protein
VKWEELADSLEELWLQQAEILEQMEALEQQMKKRDQMNRLMVSHVERLVREKEDLLRMLGTLAALKHLG